MPVEILDELRDLEEQLAPINLLQEIHAYVLMSPLGSPRISASKDGNAASLVRGFENMNRKAGELGEAATTARTTGAADIGNKEDRLAAAERCRWRGDDSIALEGA